jgi:hypothetical protein
LRAMLACCRRSGPACIALALLVTPFHSSAFVFARRHHPSVSCSEVYLPPMRIIIILVVVVIVWFLWSFIAALIRQSRKANTMLTILHNKKELDSFVESLTVSLGEAADRYDRIDILTARLPRYLSLVTGQPVQRWEKWVKRNPKKIERFERTLDNDPDYLGNVMSDIDKFFPR